MQRQSSQLPACPNGERTQIDHSEEAIPKEAMLISRVGALNVQACCLPSVSEEEMTRFVNSEVMCGTSNGWVFSKRPEVAPVACEKFLERTHYIFDC